MICIKCGKSKSIENFYKKTNKNINTKCKDCCVKYQRNKYKNNKYKFKELNKNNRIKLAQQVDKLKVKPCVDCGNIYEQFCMDFDHINNNKIASISLMVHNTWSIKNIKKEINKTELVCVLCHKTRTYLRCIKSSNKIILRNANFINSFKPTHCPICNQQRELWQMEFDHIKGIKKAPISTLVSGRYSLTTIEKEMGKCQIICSLCHRRKTFKEGNYKNYSN